MEREKITEGWFFFRCNINSQLLTEENAQYIFPFLGKQLMRKIETDKMIIPKDDFIADIHINFMTEKEYNKKKRVG